MDAITKLTNDIKIRLGHGLVDIELEPEHYNYAIEKALDRFRQRSENSVEEAFIFMEFQIDQTEYKLPDEVIEVRQIFRRGVGGQSTGGGTYLDPFAMAYTNMYLLQSGGQGGLAAFDQFHQYQELMGRLFGRDVNFKWNPNDHKLTIVRAVNTPETVLLWAYKKVPDDVLINDIYAKNWIRDWSIAECKMILGHAYSKFSQIVGPGGGTTLNGDTLKSEAQTEFDRLELEIINYMNGETPLGIIIG